MNAFVHCKCTLWVGYSINYFYFTASVTNKAMLQLIIRGRERERERERADYNPDFISVP